MFRLGYCVHAQGCMCAFAIDQAWQINVMWLVWLSMLSPCSSLWSWHWTQKGNHHQGILQALITGLSGESPGVNALCEEENMTHSSLTKEWVMCDANAQNLSCRQWRMNVLCQLGNCKIASSGQLQVYNFPLWNAMNNYDFISNAKNRRWLS